ncbi:MAG: hypothetical protein QG637_1866 [Chloroflexota bacterium]|nr:hypothetical protein [Chloroflexota bacterium]
MQITKHEKFIQRRSRLGTYASLGGLAVLVAGFVASLQQNQSLLWVSLIAIVIGFILAQFGNYSLRRWGRSPRPDQVIETALKGFDDRYHYYAWALPQPYVLLSPQGIHLFIVRDQTGQISVNGAQWQSKFNITRLLMAFAQEGLGSPTSEAQDAAGRLTAWIKTKLPEFSAPVQPIIVFIDPRAQLQITEPVVPVVEPKNLKKWLRGTGKGDTLKNAELRALEEVFAAAAAARMK